ncbi:unnamed protein product [Periconia digitata]|uniref:Uncharacterized protein n=1 Tax=Periconia digitata TaxID=1303443 RepID=A0A9W4UG87_9PLEO|nr:unnamed protein product [Periconia digitata]
MNTMMNWFVPRNRRTKIWLPGWSMPLTIWVQLLTGRPWTASLLQHHLNEIGMLLGFQVSAVSGVVVVIQSGERCYWQVTSV